MQGNSLSANIQSKCNLNYPYYHSLIVEAGLEILCNVKVNCAIDPLLYISHCWLVDSTESFYDELTM